MLAAAAVLSRLMGLVRDKVISWQFGAGNEADMYFAAFVVPDIINYLLARRLHVNHDHPPALAPLRGG